MISPPRCPPVFRPFAPFAPPPAPCFPGTVDGDTGRCLPNLKALSTEPLTKKAMFLSEFGTQQRDERWPFDSTTKTVLGVQCARGSMGAAFHTWRNYSYKLVPYPDQRYMEFFGPSLTEMINKVGSSINEAIRPRYEIWKFRAAMVKKKREQVRCGRRRGGGRGRG